MEGSRRRAGENVFCYLAHSTPFASQGEQVPLSQSVGLFLPVMMLGLLKYTVCALYCVGFTMYSGLARKSSYASAVAMRFSRAVCCQQIVDQAEGKMQDRDKMR